MRIKNKYNLTFKTNDNAVICEAELTDIDPKIAEIFRYLPCKELKTHFKGVAVYKDGDERNSNEAREVAKTKCLRQAYSYYTNLVLEADTKYCRLLDLTRKVACAGFVRQRELTNKIIGLTKREKE